MARAERLGQKTPPDFALPGLTARRCRSGLVGRKGREIAKALTTARIRTFEDRGAGTPRPRFGSLESHGAREVRYPMIVRRWLT